MLSARIMSYDDSNCLLCSLTFKRCWAKRYSREGMSMKEAAVILAVSILIQLVTAYIALTHIRITGGFRAWLVISSALVAMCARQRSPCIACRPGSCRSPPI